MELYEIATCSICIVAHALRVCDTCQFKAGLEYWLCDCPQDRVKHKSQLFCLLCDMKMPVKLKPSTSRESKIIQELGFYD